MHQQEEGNQSTMMMMSSLKLVLIFGVALGFYYSNAENTNLLLWPSSHNTNNTDHFTDAPHPSPRFDYFVFVLRWPAAFCNIQRYKNKPCNPDPPLDIHRDKFTVHGLWPQLNGGVSPLYCSDRSEMNRYIIGEFWDDVYKYWPDLFSAEIMPGAPNIWTRQWIKHGRCSSGRFGRREYIQKTLNLAKKYAKPIFDELQNRGITPDGSSARREEEIKEVVKKVTGCYNPMISIQLNDLGDHLLSEIKLCVQKDGETLFDCDPLYKFAAPRKD